jgi:hypothetical protein
MHRDFKGVWIPKEVWLNKNLTIMEKLFLVEIDSLDNSDGCFASNKHFSGFFRVSKNRCTEIIKSLEKKGLITVKLIRKGKQIVKRELRVLPIRKTEQPYSENRDNPVRETEQPYSENREDNNTSFNNTMEGNARAFDFFKKENPSRCETWLMQNRKKIKNWVKFVNHFNNKFDEEELKYSTRVIESRLSRFCDNWAEVERKDESKTEVVELPKAWS